MIKLIDREGRVFGIVNIIDLTVILFLISTITGFSWLIYTGELFNDHDYRKKIYTEKTIELSLSDQPISTFERLKKILQESQQSESSTVKIINITDYSYTEKKGHIEIVKKNEVNFKIILTIKTLKDYYTGIHYHNNQPLQINSTIEIKDIDINNSNNNHVTITKIFSGLHFPIN